MGRITVFTTAEDLNSRQLVKELEKRSLPYSEIDVVAFPSKFQDLKSMVDAPSIPHVFFNTRYVGGLEQCMRELKRWDNSTRYPTPIEKYEAEIASGFDPSNDRLALPDDADKVAAPPAKAHKAKMILEMPDGTKCLIREVIDKLRDLVPRETHTYKGSSYRRSFTGKTLVSVCKAEYKISVDEGARFAAHLCKEGVLRHVDSVNFPPRSKASFKCSSHEVYRLSCDAKEKLLNSFLTWPLDAEPTTDCLGVVENLSRLLSVMELSSLDPVDGLLNMQHCASLKKFSKFEEACCELQNIAKEALDNLDEEAMTAFALNLYWVMVRYAYLKYGIPASEDDRIDFMRTTRFDLAGEYYTLEEWSDLLTARSNPEGHDIPSSVTMSFSRKSRLSSIEMTASSLGDSVLESTISDSSVTNDKRIYFALFIGAYGGSRWSAPFAQFTPDNLDEQLDIAAKVFCQEDHNVEIHRHEHKVELISSVFKVYRSDFNPNDKDMLKGLIPYLGGKKRSDLQGMLLEHKNIKIVWKDPELGRHTVSGPWYRKPVPCKKTTTGFAGFKIVKTHTPHVSPSKSKQVSPSKTKQVFSMKGFNGRLPES